MEIGGYLQNVGNHNSGNFGGMKDLHADANRAKTLRAALAAYAPEGDEGKAYTAQLQTVGLPELEGEMQRQVITRTLKADDLRQKMEEQQRLMLALKIQDAQQEQATQQGFQRDYANQRDTGQRVAQALNTAAPAMRQMGSVIPGMGAMGDAMQGAQAPQPDVADLYLRNGGDPVRAAQIQENLARAMELSGRGVSGNTFFKPGQPGYVDPSLAEDYVVQPLGPNSGTLVPKPNRSGALVPLTTPEGEQLGYGTRTKSGVTPLAERGVTGKDKYKRLADELKQVRKLAQESGTPELYAATIQNLQSQLGALENGGGNAGSSSPAKVRKFNPQTGLIE